MRVNTFRALIRANFQSILTGKLLAIDPSVGSRSSLPGWAYFESGKLVASGVIQVAVNNSLQARLREISEKLREQFGPVDVLAVEDIRVWRGARSMVVSLLKGVGAALCSVDAKVCLEVIPQAWHGLVGDDYEKSDEKDAIAIGEYVLYVARQYAGTKKQNKPSSRSGASTGRNSQLRAGKL